VLFNGQKIGRIRELVFAYCTDFVHFSLGRPLHILLYFDKVLK
jgi:hypothetical protein